MFFALTLGNRVCATGRPIRHGPPFPPAHRLLGRRLVALSPGLLLLFLENPSAIAFALRRVRVRFEIVAYSGTDIPAGDASKSHVIRIMRAIRRYLSHFAVYPKVIWRRDTSATLYRNLNRYRELVELPRRPSEIRPRARRIPFQYKPRPIAGILPEW